MSKESDELVRRIRETLAQERAKQGTAEQEEKKPNTTPGPSGPPPPVVPTIVRPPFPGLFPGHCRHS